MLKVVVDTNVLISGLLGSGASSAILDLWRDKRFVIVTSTDLVNELIATLSKPKISKRFSEIVSQELIELIEERAVFIDPKIKFEICRDPKDNKVLECAVEGKADLIATGDNDLLVLHPFRNIDIIPPSELLKRLKR